MLRRQPSYTKCCGVTACCCPSERAQSPPLGRRARRKTPSAGRAQEFHSWFEGRRSETAPGVWPQARLARDALAGPRVASPSSGGTSLPESRPSWALEARRARHRERWASRCPEAAIYTPTPGEAASQQTARTVGLYPVHTRDEALRSQAVEVEEGRLPREKRHDDARRRDDGPRGVRW